MDAFSKGLVGGINPTELGSDIEILLKRSQLRHLIGDSEEVNINEMQAKTHLDRGFSGLNYALEVSKISKKTIQEDHCKAKRPLPEIN